MLSVTALVWVPPPVAIPSAMPAGASTAPPAEAPEVVSDCIAAEPFVSIVVWPPVIGGVPSSAVETAPPPTCSSSLRPMTVTVVSASIPSSWSP